MNIVITFYNIGGYHAARLAAANIACQKKGWHLTAIQLTDKTEERPWGNMEGEIKFPVKTLLPLKTTPPHINRTPWSSLAANLISSCLNTLKPDIIAIPGWGFPISRAALNWSQRQGIPAILMSESKWDDEKRQWWKEEIKSWLYVRKYAAALVGGKLHRDYLIRLGFPRDRIFFGYDVVNNDYFALGAEAAKQNPTLVRQRQPKIPNKPYFIVLTRLIQRKNVCRLVESFAAYRQEVGEDAWDLVICGSGAEETNLRTLILNKKLNNSIHLPGFISYQNIIDWYGLANAFIHPAWQEQWGLVVNEACAAGLPILCSRTVGACHELVRDGDNGFLFNPESTEEMTSKLLAIHQLTPDSRLKMGQLSQKIVANYSPEYFATGLLNAIAAATGQS